MVLLRVAAAAFCAGWTAVAQRVQTRYCYHHLFCISRCGTPMPGMLFVYTYLFTHTHSILLYLALILILSSYFICVLFGLRDRLILFMGRGGGTRMGTTASTSGHGGQTLHVAEKAFPCQQPHTFPMPLPTFLHGFSRCC